MSFVMPVFDPQKLCVAAKRAARQASMGGILMPNRIFFLRDLDYRAVLRRDLWIAWMGDR